MRGVYRDGGVGCQGGGGDEAVPRASRSAAPAHEGSRIETPFVACEVPRVGTSAYRLRMATRRRRRPHEPPTDRVDAEEHLRQLRALVRRARAQIADAPEALRHLADALEIAVHDFTADEGPARLEAASVQILASTAAAGALLLDLAVFAGRLAELGRVAGTVE